MTARFSRDGAPAQAEALARVRLGEAHYTSLLLPATPRADGGYALAADWQASPSWALHTGRLRADALQVGLEQPGFAAMAAAVEQAVEQALGQAVADARRGAPGAAASATTPMWRLRLDHNAAGPADIRDAPVGSIVTAQAALLLERVRPPARVQLGPRLRNPADPLVGVKRAAVVADFAVLRAAQRAGFDECVLLDVDGSVSEAITSAIWFGKDGVVWTADARHAPLRSTTTALLMAWAAGYGQRVQTGSFAAEALLHADWAVLANAVAGARPIASVEGRAVPPPPAWLVATSRDLVDGGPAASVAVANLRDGRGPAWACAAVADGWAASDGPLP